MFDADDSDFGQRREHLRPGDLALSFQAFPDPLEDGPQHLALGFGQPCLAAEACDIAIGLPALELPGVDHLFPLRQQEMRTELVSTHRRAGIPNQGLDLDALDEPGLTDMRLAESGTDRIEGMHVDAFSQAAVHCRAAAAGVFAGHGPGHRRTS